MSCIFLTSSIFVYHRINMQYQTDRMLFFFNIPKRGCIPGKNIPLLSIHMGSPGRIRTRVSRIRVDQWRGSEPRVVAPAHVAPGRFVHCSSTTHNLWRSTVIRSLPRVCGPRGRHDRGPAQTYYYYPSTVTSSPVINAGTTSAPVYYVPSTYRNQATWNGYAPQYYQVNYTSPVYQAPIRRSTYQTTYTQPTSSRRMPCRQPRRRRRDRSTSRRRT